ncbi:MAG TPA: NADH-quinone oxidoreductase subunit N [Thermodesulfobacteriaceae bacterium]|nr:NADH-quinone oxidoreductase subunit N [Thermodesulfobacteriaceae bacterium]
MITALLPEIIIGIASLFFFTSSLLDLKDRTVVNAAIGFSGLSIAAALISLGSHGDFFYYAYGVDRFSRFFVLLITGTFFLACIITKGMKQIPSEKISELYFFISVVVLGLIMITTARELITLFIALELASYPLYIITSYRTGLGYQFEAAVKYMIFGVVSTAFMLYGISYLYGAFGTTFLHEIVAEVHGHMDNSLAIAGAILFLVGLAYKLALFPFHFWAPDVYAGAAGEVVTFLASLPKLGAIALLVRTVSMFSGMENLLPVLAVLAVLSMTAGNLMALNQQELKRLLAYSAVSHAGYMFLGLLAPDQGGFTAMLFYGTVYAIMSLGAFLVALQVAGDEKGDIPLSNLKGLWGRSPLMAILLTIALASLAGLPPTGGFTGKLLLLTAAWKAGYLWAAVAGVLNTVIGIYVYLKAIKISLVGDEEDTHALLASPTAIRIAAAAICITLLYLGITPGKLISMADMAVNALS